MQTSTPPPLGVRPPPLQPRLSIGRRIAVPVTVASMTLTYESLVILAQWGAAGFVWNWPTGVSVARAGRVTRLAVVDVTRIALWICWVITLVAAILTGVAALRNLGRRHANE